MRRYPYLRCSGDKNRICLLCDSPYMARNPEETNTFCPQCFTQERKHELHHVKINLKRAEKAGTHATLTLKQWLSILDHFNWRCAYCAGPYEVVEHVLSINLGGGTTALNCVPACVPCNARKDRGSNSTAMPLAKIEQVKQQLERIAKALGGEPGDLLVSDAKYEAMLKQEKEESVA